MNVRCLQMAGATGIEPVSTVLETDVLPLDQAPKLDCFFILPYQFLKSNSKMHKKMILSDSNVIMSQCIQVDNVPIGTLSTCRVKL